MYKPCLRWCSRRVSRSGWRSSTGGTWESPSSTTSTVPCTTTWRRSSPASPTATGLSATFRVRGLDRFVEDLQTAGVQQLHKVVELGEGKRLVSFRDADENRFSLIDIGF